MAFLLSIPAIIWIVISIIFFAIGEYFAKVWANNPNTSILAIILTANLFSMLAFLPALLHKNQIAIMGTAWIILAAVAVVAVGVLGFHEKLSYYQLIGLALGFISIFFLDALF